MFLGNGIGKTSDRFYGQGLNVESRARIERVYCEKGLLGNAIHGNSGRTASKV